MQGVSDHLTEGSRVNATSGTQPEQLLSVDELCRWLNVSRATVYTWRHLESGPPAVKAGRLLRFRRRDVEAWLEQRDDQRGSSAA